MPGDCPVKQSETLRLLRSKKERGGKKKKHVQKKPGVDHPIASVDDLGAYEVAHGNFFHKNNPVAILNKELANGSLYMRSMPQNGICLSESSQAMMSLDKFDMRSAIFDSFLTSHHASHH